MARDARNRIPAWTADASVIRFLSPAPGHVVALWRANWGWGEEQALLIEHTKKELNLSGRQDLMYLSEFDHLNLKEPLNFSRGEFIARGQPLATVFRPGGRSEYLPEGALGSAGGHRRFADNMEAQQIWRTLLDRSHSSVG